MNNENLEQRLSRLERKADWWDIAGFLAICFCVAGLIDIAKQLWLWIFG
jgi:hypothetical protein